MRTVHGVVAVLPQQRFSLQIMQPLDAVAQQSFVDGAEGAAAAFVALLTGDDEGRVAVGAVFDQQDRRLRPLAGGAHRRRLVSAGDPFLHAVGRLHADQIGRIRACLS